MQILNEKQCDVCLKNQKKNGWKAKHIMCGRAGLVLLSFWICVCVLQFLGGENSI